MVVRLVYLVMGRGFDWLALLTRSAASARWAAAVGSSRLSITSGRQTGVGEPGPQRLLERDRGGRVVGREAARSSGVSSTSQTVTSCRSTPPVVTELDAPPCGCRKCHPPCSARSQPWLPVVALPVPGARLWAPVSEDGGSCCFG